MAAVLSVSWSPGSKRIASASDDATVQVWDANDGQHAFTCNGHSKAVYSVNWSFNGADIASGGADSTAQVWQAA